MVESDHVYGVDCDESALQIAKDNATEFELEDSISLVYGVVGSGEPTPNFIKKSKYSRKRGSNGPPPTQSVATTKSDAPPFPFRTNSVDTVVCNPPFGTKRAGIDIEFLHVAWFVHFFNLRWNISLYYRLAAT